MSPKKRSGKMVSTAPPRELKPKGKEAVRPKGIQKFPRKEPWKKSTAAEIPEAQVAAAGPKPSTMTSRKITYLELQPPDEDELSSGYTSRHLKKEKKDYNGSEVKISEDAYGRLTKMYIEVEKRTPESNGIDHIFEDYRGYGIMEVIGAQVMDYYNEIQHASPRKTTLYEIVEALSFFFDGTYDSIWFNVDDGDGVEKMMNLVGVMFVDCFRRLNTKENRSASCLLSTPELSPFKNLGLVMGLAIGFSDQWEELVENGASLFWAKELVGLARSKGIALRNTNGLIIGKEGENTDEEEEEDAEEEDAEEEERKKATFDFSAKVDRYKVSGKKLGGDHYDLTLLAPAKPRKRKKKRSLKLV